MAKVLDGVIAVRKTCCKCKERKPLSEFGRYSRSKDGYSYRCRECSRAYSRNQYATKRDYCLAKSHKRTTELFVSNTKRLNAYKAKRGCRYCSENDPVALDMHHRDPKEKKHSISSRMGTAKWDKLMKEVVKCDVVCSNCHRKLHAGRELVSLPR